MTDTSIIELYFRRSERAINESQASYGGYCYRVADGILRDARDSEESMNDTWLAAWNAIPPTLPNCLKAYFGALTRRISVDRLRRRSAAKRGGGEALVALEELAECIPSGFSVERTIENKLLIQAFNSFLASQPEAERNLFVARYWYGLPVEEIAARYGLALHTERRAIANAGDQSRERGAYEDGSFHISASAMVAQERYLYEVYLEKNGCLPCDDMTAGGACEYVEWEYTAGRGDKVSIAVRDVSTNEAWAQYELLVLYSGNGAVMTVRASYGCQRVNGDEKLFAERLADSIDFSAVAGADAPEDAVLILKGG